MRVVHDTDVASGSTKQNLPPSLVARIAPHEVAITFVTVGELTRWVFARDLGTRRRGQIEHLIATTPKIPAGVDVARKWGELVAAAAESATEQTYSPREAARRSEPPVDTRRPARSRRHDAQHTSDLGMERTPDEDIFAWC